MSRSIVRPFLATFALVLAGAAHAATYTWPGAAPCNGTLQACIDGTSNGDRIEIASDTIAEDISLYDADRTLAPAAGFHPVFGAGHWLSITSSSISGDRTVAVSGLSFNDGYVFVNYRGSGTSSINLRGLTLNYHVFPTSNYIRVQAEHGTLNATVYNNSITGLPPSNLEGMITFAAHGGTLNGDAYFNRIQCANGDLTPGAGILADYAGTGSAGTARIFGNEVRGSFGFGSIVASEGLGHSDGISFNARVYSNVVVGTGSPDSDGIRYLVNSGTISAQAVENTVTRVDWGLVAEPYSGAPAASRITGLMSSNLVRANTGLYINSAHAPAMTNDYNLINAGSNIATLGTHTITADARLVSDAYPRLSADSSAINAGDTATVGIGIIVNSLPVLDADGLRRLKGTPANADIGAYEYGDFTFEHTATDANTFNHVTDFSNPAATAPDARLIVTSNYDFGLPDGILYSAPYGVYRDLEQWALFSQDFATMPIGAHFDVFAPAAGSGSFVHVSTASNIAGAGTSIDNPTTNSLPDRIILATQNWTAGGMSLYNPHPIGIGYLGHWFIFNLDITAMEPDLGFNVYSQEASPNAFRVSAIGTTGPIRLDHPLLDGVPCARLHVTRIISGSSSDYTFDVDYDAGHWRIFPHGGSTTGDSYNVVVDPAQVFACTDRIFANGFD